MAVFESDLLKKHLKCEPSPYLGRIGRLPAGANTLQATLTVQPRHARAVTAVEEDSEEADPEMGLN